VSTSSRQIGERALVARIRNRALRQTSKDLRLSIGDDCALLRLRTGEELAVTTDLSIAGRHFQLEWHSPEAIGHRTLARGLSDLAAMGARPVAAFLSLGLPPQIVGRWLNRFLDGFFALADANKTPLAGGDLAESPAAVADIVLIGAVHRSRALLRSGARPGDLLYVTGQLGGASAGLAQLKKLAEGRHKRASKSKPVRELRIPPDLEDTLQPHLSPQPRLAQGQYLARHSLATAAIDLSDGLSTDLAHLCNESGVAAELDAAALPIHSAANLAQALHGGEDYELLFTAPPSARIPRNIAGVPVTRIGRMVRARADRPQIMLVTQSRSRPLESRGWEHFS
jgi:thiamine-monophosphate kinase